MTRKSTASVRERVEEKYETEERTVDTSNDHAGQMTIAFCDVISTRSADAGWWI